MRNFLLGGKDSKHPIKVLVVDGDLQNVHDLSRVLRDRGCELLEATTFEAGRQLWIAEKPGALVADIRLGQYNGLQLLLRAKSDRPDLKAVITSATADTVLASETQRFGGTFLVKPVDTKQLLVALFGPQEPAVMERFGERRAGERRTNPMSDYLPDRRLGDRRHPRAE